MTIQLDNHSEHNPATDSQEVAGIEATVSCGDNSRKDYKAPCRKACPADIDVPAYVALAGMGKYKEAIRIIREKNPFPWICGLVCTRPCESVCVRGRMDTPVAIKALKEFLSKKVMEGGGYENPPKAENKHKKVCVVGSGPSGLTAAYFLALKGYQVRILESLPVHGGMLTVGIPRYRLPMDMIDREVKMVEQLGVEIDYNTRFGEDTTYEELKREGFEAFFLAIGAHRPMGMGIKGECDFSKVMEAVTLLKDTALGTRHDLGDRVVVIGGGNVAIDAARTARRLGSKEVVVAYRRSREEMPADDEEIEHAEQEGVTFCYLTIPVCVQGKDGSLSSLECVKAKLVEQPGKKRKYPVPIDESNHKIGVDTIISAIGQKVDYDCLYGLKSLKLTAWGTIEADKETMTTSMSDVFAAGDAVSGPATVIEAIAGGKRAAESIDTYLSAAENGLTDPEPEISRKIDCLPALASEKTHLTRPEMPLLDRERRLTSFDQVESGYDEQMAKKESLRCLRCDVCQACGNCVDICQNKMQIGALQLGYLNPDRVSETNLEHAKDKCISCGACAANCPMGAMKIESIEGYSVLSLCGTELNRKKIEHCKSCGKDLGTTEFLNFVQNRLKTSGQSINELFYLCPDCAKTEAAKSYAIF